MSTIDWPLVLDFVEALAPVLAVGGIALAAHLAVNGYRKQKIIDRRLDWYERMHRRLFTLSQSLSLLESASDRPSLASERADQFMVEVGKYSAEIDESWLYANQPGFTAVQNVHEALFYRLSKPEAYTEADFSALRILIRLGQKALAHDIRSDMRMGKVEILKRGKET